MGRKKPKYSKEYAKRLYGYFVSYSEGQGAPSFTKFARSIGVLPEDLEGFRKNKDFEAAYRACIEIRRDYLIDNALSRRFDGSFTKFLLTEMSESDGENTELRVSLEIAES